MCRLLILVAVFLCLSAAVSLCRADDSDIVINELMYNPISDNQDEEYIELYNKGTTTVDLTGWEFTDGVDFVFPAFTELGPGEYLLVCRNAALVSELYDVANVIGNYSGKCDNGGENIELSNSYGVVIDSLDYDDAYPWPISPDGVGRSLECMNPDADNDHPRNWAPSVNEGGWTHVSRTGTATSSLLYIYLVGAGECLIDDVSIVPEGGGAEHIVNGGFEDGSYNWSATGNHSNSVILLEGSHSGESCMKIVATSGGGSSSNSLNCYTSPSLTVGASYTLSFWVKHLSGEGGLYSRLSNGGIGGESQISRYYTPGQQNSVFTSNIPPFIDDVQHFPLLPTSSDTVTITAEVTDTDLPTVQLAVNIGDSTINYGMFDDGLHGDGAAGDDVYGTVLPAKPNQTVVRYWVIATDSVGGGVRQFPYAADPETALGYFVYDNDVTSNFPVFFWSIPQTNLDTLNSNPQSDNYVKGIFVANGEVFDQVGFRYRGSPWTRMWPKKHWKVKFNKGHYFDDKKTINFQCNYSDKAFMREHLAYELFRQIGHKYCETELVRIQLNGEFFGLYTRVENPGNRWCENHDLDENGSLYKAYDDARTRADYELYYSRETGDETDYTDLTQFLNEFNSTPEAQILPYIEEHMDIYSFTGYLTGQALLNGSDHVAKNYWLYRWPGEDGLWEMFPWDLDLTWGRNFECGGLDVLNDVIRWNNHILFGTQEYPKCDGPWNRIIDKFLLPAKLRMFYYSRVQYELNHVFTTAQLYPVIEGLRSRLSSEVPLDRAKWGSYNSSSTWDFDTNVNDLKNYIANRITYLWAFLTPDADSDGMPDWWEEGYETPTVPGLTGMLKNSNDADQDNDLDGRTNHEEWIAGTDPTDPDSRLKVALTLSPNGDVATITWQASPYRDYNVYYSDDEYGPSMTWVLAEDHIRGDVSGSLTWAITGTSSKARRYFRVDAVEPEWP